MTKRTRNAPAIALVNRQRRHRIPRTRLLAQLERLARREPLPHGEVTFVIVDAPESARIHRDFMDVPGSTDVITFQHGDIVVCAPVAAREAKARGLTFSNELLRYCVHGWLHLRGYDDVTERKRAVMHGHQEALVTWLEG